MSERGRTLLRALVIAGGAAVTLESLLEFRVSDWPIYVTFLAVYAVVFLPAVEALPGLRIPIPSMAVAVGFLYVGGLPILALRILTPLTWLLLRLLPERWHRHLIAPCADIAGGYLFWDLWAPHSRGPSSEFTAEWGMVSIGLAVRWWVATLAAGGPPAANPWAITLGELAGYASWGLLSILPIYPDRPLIPLVGERRSLRAALGDIGLVVALALTPFVFLITYGYQADGLAGAAAWSLAALGLHFILKYLNERRLVVEAQNRRLEALNRELEHRERLSTIGKMSSVVSHQILHQLGVIGLYADLIRKTEGDGAGQAREHAAAIEGALRDVNRVLTDLLVFGKDLRLNLYEHSLDRVIEECLEDCGAEAAQRQVRLSRAGAEGLALTLDKLKIKQAIVNVLRNSIEASPPGGNVVVETSVAREFAEISISDRGRGISPGDREAIFTPFFTTKERGIGLGLAIAREFAEAHGGGLRVEGDAPGAKFVFRLPTREN